MSKLFGPVSQIAYVTRDLDKTVSFFIKTAGIGPWFLRSVSIPDAAYRGERSPVNIRMALANSGTLQIEIIEPRSGEASLFNEWLEKSSDPLVAHHVCAWPVKYDEVYEGAIESGYESVLEGDLPPAGRFVYFAHRSLPTLLFELIELTPVRRLVFEAIAKAAESWDGSNGVRSVSDLLTKY